MSVNLNRRLTVSMLTVLIVGMVALASGSPFSHRFHQAWGARYSERPEAPRSYSLGAPVDMMHRWNGIAMNASGLDHVPVAPGENRVFGEQYGPVRASRALAIVHIAIFEAMNAIAGSYQSYLGLPPVTAATSMDAAIAQAAHDTLNALFPSQTANCDRLLAEDLSQIPNGPEKTNGIDLGRRVAALILALRANDGSQHVEPRMGIEFIPKNDPGKWRQDPISKIPIALGAYWGAVKPFVLKSGDQFRAPPPPALHSLQYTRAFDEVKRLGGDGVVTPTQRTPEQTFIGLYWAYDGTPSLCAPPRLYKSAHDAHRRSDGHDWRRAGAALGAGECGDG